MIYEFFGKGIIIGLMLAVPIGAIGVLFIQRAINKGGLRALPTGAGAATADSCYGAVVAFGLTLISEFFTTQKTAIQGVGIIFLLYFGIKTLLSRPHQKEGKGSSSGAFIDYLSTFVLTISNPTTIAAFMAVFASFGILENKGNYIASSALVMGVFLGSMLWWIVLGSLISLFRSKINDTFLLAINRIAGLIIIGFALMLLRDVF